ncbi:hypothetical protein [Rheinheimera sp. SA_1]|uniref:hypothetical protein n=1 Tax=Rheinheimera sp. SA_1 TaxID=1827365 RepID=UPI000A778BB5|nr:hypothetical protein [Rheinheimera sp. SA_1]
MTKTKLKNLLRSMADYRRGLRLLTGQPKLDVVIICPLRDEAERSRYFKATATRSCQQNGARLHLKGVAGQVRLLNVTTEELVQPDSRELAKQAVIAALDWAQQQGAKVVLLAAAMQSLFGGDGRALKQRFPSLLLTLGQNGRSQLLCAEIDRALRRSSFVTQPPRILVLEPDTLLGQAVCAHLQAKGRQVVALSTSQRMAATLQQQTGMPVYPQVSAVGAVDVVVVCGDSLPLATDDIAALRRSNRKLLVIDQSTVAAVDQHVSQQCQSLLVRLEGGNGFASGLNMVPGRLSYRQLRLSRGSMVGDVAEAMALFHAVYQDHNHLVLNRDWFDVNPYNQALLAEAFYSLRVGLPNPHSFGKPVNDFGLELNPMTVARTLIQQVAAPGAIQHGLN